MALDKKGKKVDPTKRTKEEEQKSEITPQKDKESFLNLNLTEDEEKKVLDEICEELEEIDVEMGPQLEINEKAKNSYDCVAEYTDWPWEGAASLYLPVVRLHIDSVVVRGKKVLYGAKPACIIVPHNQTEMEIYKPKEDYLDYKARVQMKIKRNSAQSIHDATIHGLGITRHEFVEEIIEEETEQKEYSDKEEFVTKFSEDKEYSEMLEKQGKVKVWEKKTKTRIVPKLQWVDLANFYAHKYDYDLNKARCVGEKLTQEFMEVEEKEQLGKYKNVDLLRDELKDDFYKKPIELYRIIYYYKPPKAKKKIKCVFIFQRDKKIMLKAIRYPHLRHTHCDYIPWRIQEVMGSLYGKGIFEILKDINDQLNMIVNGAINSETLRTLPIFGQSKRSHFDPTAQKLYPGYVISNIEDGDFFAIYQNSVPATNMIPFLNIVDRFGERTTGVTALTSGRESPVDPEASGKKTAILLAESNLRLGDYIDTLMYSLVEVYYQLDRNSQQYFSPDEYFILDINGKFIKYMMTEEKVYVKAEDYIPQGSIAALDPEVENRRDLALVSILLKLPFIQQDEKKLIFITKTLVENWSDKWAKRAHELFPSDEELMQQQVMKMVMAMDRYVNLKGIKNEVDRQKMKQAIMQVIRESMMGRGMASGAAGSPEVPEEVG